MINVILLPAFLINFAAVTEINLQHDNCMTMHLTISTIFMRIGVSELSIQRKFTRPYAISSVSDDDIAEHFLNIIRSSFFLLFPFRFSCESTKAECDACVAWPDRPSFSCTRKNSTVSAATRSKELSFVGRQSQKSDNRNFCHSCGRGKEGKQIRD